MENGGFEPIPHPSDGIDTDATETPQIRTNVKQINALSDSISSSDKQILTPLEHLKSTSLHAKCITCVQQNVSDDLREVMDSWDVLPSAIKVGILAMIRAAKQS